MWDLVLFEFLLMEVVPPLQQTKAIPFTPALLHRPIEQVGSLDGFLGSNISSFSSSLINCIPMVIKYNQNKRQ